MAVEKKLSEQISDFLSLMNGVKASYDYFHSKMVEQDKATQDLLHTLELDDLGYRERAKLSTKLRDIRRGRRAYKDSVEELTPLLDYIEHNKKALDNLRNTLGELRKQERYHENRRYYPRIIKGGDKNE